jgi:UDP-2,3-diacylglucosamine pyrophosphatase LpxH
MQRYKTVFISDVHLGTPDCKIHEVNDFLRRIRCEKLVLNGDIIDSWHLKRKPHHWNKHHTRFVRLVLRKMEKEATDVVYLRGNHDDELRRYMPLRMARLQIANEHVHETPRGNYIVIHGDVFDQITTHCRWLSVLGSIGYDWLLTLNRAYNWWRAVRGKEYFSLSKAIKAKVKRAVSYAGKYEEQLQMLATQRGACGVICGHIHTAADKEINGVHYLNSGDWVETRSAIVEHLDRRMEVLRYEDFMLRLRAQTREEVLA